MKTFEEVRDILPTQNPATWVATAVGDQPHLRAMAMWFCRCDRFLFPYRLSEAAFANSSAITESGNGLL